MTGKEAYTIIINKFKGRVVKSCYEYKSVYVFDLSRKEGELDALWSVDKETGVVKNFKPFDIPVEEYRTGVKLM